MLRALAYALIALVLLAVAELWLIGTVAASVGILPTIGLLVVIGVVGSLAVRRAGASVLRGMSSDLARGVVPGDLMADGAFLVLAGVLLVVPGFLTDLVALALLVPPVRSVLRRAIAARVPATVTGGVHVGRVDVGRAWIEADAHDVDVRSQAPRGTLPGGAP